MHCTSSSYAKCRGPKNCLFTVVIFFIAADQTRAMQDQFTGSAAAMSQQDPNKAFKVLVTYVRLFVIINTCIPYLFLIYESLMSVSYIIISYKLQNTPVA